MHKYHASIGYHKKTVTFQPLNEPKFSFLGANSNLYIPIIFAMKAHRIIDVANEGLMVDNVRVVCQYADVFLEYLSGLPPNR